MIRQTRPTTDFGGDGGASIIHETNREYVPCRRVSGSSNMRDLRDDILAGTFHASSWYRVTTSRCISLPASYRCQASLIVL